MTTDSLGSTRVVTDGNKAVIARHDYLPFGEEIPSGIGNRPPGLGYVTTDDTRQRFTEKERDSESSLDYFGARYFSSPQGRFTSADPFDPVVERGASHSEEGEAHFHRYLTQPQHWNRYCYVLDNPLRLVDPDGHQAQDALEKAVFGILKRGLGNLAKAQVKAGVLGALVKGALEYFFGPDLLFPQGGP